MNTLTVRAARESDLTCLTDIYNHYVHESPATFDITPVTLDDRREWFHHYSETGPHRLLVAVRRQAVVGYASSSRFRPKPAYLTSVETSIYVRPELRGQQVGSLLYAELFRVLGGEDLHRAYAGVTLPNPASIALHKKFGFQEVGVYREVGRKFGEYWSVAWFEKQLG
ncbi:MAG: N-acetyltransferase family protein [Chloroflexi bacterium]|nr:N-acetyltransferase family protein [Chloroflexota bacterium]MCL5274916.1 N-acetyltransferase family protein [Chloroflexota bacterium]